jgi:hypothetical protein
MTLFVREMRQKQKPSQQQSNRNRNSNNNVLFCSNSTPILTFLVVYPSLCKEYMDAFKVRWLLPGRLTQEFFRNYGRDEIIQ